MSVTRVGFGAWAIGGTGWAYGWGPQDDDASVNAIRHAVESGINWIDTAAVYGLGHSEEVVARALAPFGDDDRPYVFTKCGLVWDESDRVAPPRAVATPDSIRREVDASLARLRTERIDLYQVHVPPTDGTPVEKYWQAMLDLREAGKVRAVGLSNHGVKELDRAEPLGRVESLQPPFSLIDRDAADVIDWCREHGSGVIVYSPMQSGLLSGSFTVERAAALPDDDWRSRDPEFTGDRLGRNLALVDALRGVAERYATTVGAVAVAWTLAYPGVTAAIVGAREPSQVDGWVDAPGVPLDSDDLAEIAAAVERTGSGHGPVPR